MEIPSSDLGTTFASRNSAAVALVFECRVVSHGVPASSLQSYCLLTSQALSFSQIDTMLSGTPPPSLPFFFPVPHRFLLPPPSFPYPTPATCATCVHIHTQRTKPKAFAKPERITTAKPCPIPDPFCTFHFGDGGESQVDQPSLELGILPSQLLKELRLRACPSSSSSDRTIFPYSSWPLSMLQHMWA